MTYTTQDLIDILDRELRATWQGKRLLLSPAERLDNPVIAKALDLGKIGKVFAYQDFRAQIHTYQRNHQVSGIVWRTCQFRGDRLEFPELHNQLVAVPGDKEILMAAKARAMEFWQTHAEGMHLWLVAHRRRPLTRESLADLIAESEWAELDATQSELFLGLCWGNPEEAQYQWAKPNSGCHRIIATPHSEPSSIKV